ncbi:hypothetical protein QYM36_011060, partial [Artemia franciscana]
MIRSLTIDDGSPSYEEDEPVDITPREAKTAACTVSLNPVRILKAEADEEKAEIARLSSFIGAIAIGDLVKSTLGPKGMDKILVGMGRNEGVVEMTNDGATILKSIGVDNPAAKVLVDIAKGMDDEVGDGTTSVTVLASELLREAEKLIEMKFHPQTIISGWRKAVKAAKEALEKSTKNNSENQEAFKNDLLNIARTTLSSKILSQHKDFFSNLCVDAVLRLKGSGDLTAIQIIKISGGTLLDSFLDSGFLLNKKPGVNQPKRIENAKILIANTPMDYDKIKIFGSRVQVDSTAKVAELELAEKEKMKEKVDKILSHNINVFINRQVLISSPIFVALSTGYFDLIHIVLCCGFLLNKKPGVNQPKRIENAKILIANTPMDYDKIKIFGSRVQVDSTAKVAELELAEKEKMKEKVDKILSHNINVFINRQLIYNYPEQLFADAGVMAIEHADFDGIERLALVTGGEIVSTFDHPELVKLGTCELIEEKMIGEEKLLQFSGVPLGEACTLVLRGATQQILEEAERSVHDALCVLTSTVKNPKTVYGG